MVEISLKEEKLSTGQASSLRGKILIRLGEGHGADVCVRKGVGVRWL